MFILKLIEKEMGIWREKKGGGVEKQLSCPQVPMTFDTVP